MSKNIEGAAPVQPTEPDWKAEFEREREKFQLETLRTSELHQMLSKLVDLHCPTHAPGPWARGCWQCTLVGEAQALLTKPVNAGRTIPKEE